MKEIRLPNNLIEKLKTMPESGMGYQFVDFLYINGEVLKKQMVINCSLLQTNDPIDFSKIKDVKLSNV